jgi:hypothetical protein
MTKHILDDDHELFSVDSEGTQTPFTSEQRYAFYESIAAAKAVEYRGNRMAEYPSIGDQLDALWKGGEAADAMRAIVQAVKTKYPK